MSASLNRTAGDLVAVDLGEFELKGVQGKIALLQVWPAVYPIACLCLRSLQFHVHQGKRLKLCACTKACGPVPAEHAKQFVSTYLSALCSVMQSKRWACYVMFCWQAPVGPSNSSRCSVLAAGSGCSSYSIVQDCYVFTGS
jgi:hypothetical protein